MLTVCARRGVAGACLLGVTDLLEGPEGRQRIGPEALDELGRWPPGVRAGAGRQRLARAASGCTADS